jgi:AraC-like DNA-binding protein
MINLVLVRGQESGHFPAKLLPACADWGFQVKTIPAHVMPELEEIVLVDFLDPQDSLHYIQRLRNEGCCCFVLLVTPEECLPPVATLTALRIAAYIPTPVRHDVAMAALQQAASQVQLFRNHYIPRSDYAQLQQSLDLLHISQLYSQVTAGDFHCPESLAAFNGAYGTHFTTEKFACIGLQVDPVTLTAAAERMPRWPYLQHDIAAFFESRNIYAVQLHMDGFCGYLYAPGTQPPASLASDLHAVLRHTALASDQITLSCAGPVSSMADLPTLLRDAVQGLRDRICLGTEQVIDPNAHHFADPPSLHSFPQDRLVKLCACVEVSDLEGLEIELEQIIETLRKASNISATPVYSAAIRFYELLRDGSRAAVGDSLYAGADASFLFDLDSCCSLDRIRTTLLRWSRSFLESEQAPSACSGPISRSLRFIDRNLDQPLSLKQLAQEAHLSPSYYSSLFKQQVGCTFCEYVQSRRISTSVTLLMDTDMTVAEIAKQVGFSDYRYFSRLFTRIVGMNPTRYRKRHTVPLEVAT